jgi:hypothetical protein
MTRGCSKAGADIVGPDDRLVMIVGNYGSGKTEVSVNLAIRLARSGREVRVADLDIVNPYFRCREARALMERHGIRVVIPPGSQAWADLPIIVPEIQGLLQPPPGTVSIFDVGGDDVGARALASFRPSIADGAYELWQVINARRPFTDTVEGCLEMRRALEEASRLKVTGLLANTHLIDDTTPDAVLDGWRLAQAVSREAGVPVRCLAVMENLAGAPELAAVDAPLLVLRRHMLPPWATAKEDAELPAARPVPLGKPGPIHCTTTEGDADGQNRH